MNLKNYIIIAILALVAVLVAPVIIALLGIVLSPVITTIGFVLILFAVTVFSLPIKIKIGRNRRVVIDKNVGNGRKSASRCVWRRRRIIREYWIF